jgi:fructose-bisphosphate aldolase class I
MDGDHDIERCFDVTAATLREVFNELVLQRVDLDGTLLKTNMVLSGKDASGRAGPDVVGERTIDCFKQVVPASCPGVVFLSGGQSDEESVNNLNGINQQARRVSSPWELSFSYGRGLQSACLKAWSGLAMNGEEAQQAFYQRAKVTSAAREGEYKTSIN